MTRVCPKCDYIRKPTDDAPDWQCPSCQVAYVKAHGEPVSPACGRYGAPVAPSGPAASTSGWKRLAIIALIGLGVAVGRPMLPGAAVSVARAAAAQPAVSLHATGRCGYCAATRKRFERNGIQYTELDIEKSTAGYEGHRRLGGGGVPLIAVGDEVIHGYNEERSRTVLKPWFKSPGGTI